MKRRCSVCKTVREMVDLNRRRNHRGCMVENIYYCHERKDCIEGAKKFSFIWNLTKKDGKYHAPAM